MELTGVEPVSALVISASLIHRLSFSNPRSGNRLLSQTMGCSGEVLAKYPTRGVYLVHPLGVISIVLNGVKL